jgi:hypothetical protein
MSEKTKKQPLYGCFGLLCVVAGGVVLLVSMEFMEVPFMFWPLACTGGGSWLVGAIMLIYALLTGHVKMLG